MILCLKPAPGTSCSRRTKKNKAEKRQEAQDVLRQLRDGADFAALAQEYSDDGSASRGGDLGWFPEGRMVEPFEEAVFSARETGLVNRLIETEYRLPHHRRDRPAHPADVQDRHH